MPIEAKYVKDKQAGVGMHGWFREKEGFKGRTCLRPGERVSMADLLGTAFAGLVFRDGRPCILLGTDIGRILEMTFDLELTIIQELQYYREEAARGVLDKHEAAVHDFLEQMLLFVRGWQERNAPTVVDNRSENDT